MGGSGALASAQRYPALVDGVVLVAPFLGDSDLLREIRAAGGVAAWTPPRDPGTWDVEVWRSVKAWSNAGDGPIIRLAYGTEDRAAGPHALLAAALPPNRVHTLPGGHRWEVWSRLWDSVLQTWRLPATRVGAGPTTRPTSAGSG